MAFSPCSNCQPSKMYLIIKKYNKSKETYYTPTAERGTAVGYIIYNFLQNFQTAIPNSRVGIAKMFINKIE